MRKTEDQEKFIFNNGVPSKNSGFTVSFRKEMIGKNSKYVVNLLALGIQEIRCVKHTLFRQTQ